MSGSDRGRRLAVSLAAVVLFIASEWVGPPFALTGAMGRIVSTIPGPPMVGPFCLSMESIFDAAILVELLAFLVPRWRALRLSGPAGRARLWTVTTAVALALSAVQAFFMVRWLRNSDAIDGELSTAAFAVATLTAGVALKLAAAQAVSRFGLGNGFSVVIASAFIKDAIVAVDRSDKPFLGGVSGPDLTKRLLLLVVVGAFVAWVFVRERRRAVAGAALPFPASGGQPLAAALGLPSFVGGLASFGVLGGLVQAFAVRALWTQAVQVGVVAGGALVLARLFNAPKRTAAFVPEPRRALLEGAGRAIVFMLLLGAADTALTSVGSPFDVTRVVIFVAVALDLHEEWRARGKERLVPAWPLARPYAVEGALASLRAAGIAAFPRGLQHRSLLQALGPYITVDLLVPEDRAAEAQHVLEKT